MEACVVVVVVVEDEAFVPGALVLLEWAEGKRHPRAGIWLTTMPVVVPIWVPAVRYDRACPC